MKRLIGWMFLCTIAGCLADQHKSNEDLPGIYVTNYSDDDSKRWDTLFIAPVVIKRSEAFTIQKISVATKIHHGRTLPAQRRVKQWDGIYDEKVAGIELEPGKHLYYDQDRRQVLIGKQRFLKIKSLP